MDTATGTHPVTAAKTPAELGPAGLLTVLSGAGLSIVDFFIVNVALPTIDRTLDATPVVLQLVVAAYGIAYATLLVLGGRLGDHFGRRRLFAVGLALFTLTSLAGGLAPTAGLLVAARAAQGAAAALMVPQVLSIIQATTTGERRSRALGWWGATSGLAMIIGQLAGGLLVTADLAGLTWRPIFLVNVPIGLACLLALRRTVPESRSAHPLGLDRAGTPLFGALVLAVLVPLMAGRALGWPWWTWLSLGVAPVLAVLFARSQRRAEHRGATPLLPPSLLAVPSMRRGLALSAPFFAGFGAFLFVYALTLQDGLRFDAAGAGLAITPMAAGFLVASLVSSRLTARFGQRVVTTGAVAQAAGIVVLIGTVLLVWPHVPILALIPGMALAGFGQGLTMTTMFRVVLSRVPAAQAGAGSGVLVTVQQVSVAAGVATLGSSYLWLAEPGVLGIRDAFAGVMAVQVLVAFVIFVAGRKLPDPRG
ncbi:MFS transporter [Amycolatopsis sp. cmx-4-68]|uniref:MFS transporter n=1 Tax=Amycolatopsis sp. cmx-4-68 TaxID=2790938 RepID=UPI00397AA528